MTSPIAAAGSPDLAPWLTSLARNARLSSFPASPVSDLQTAETVGQMVRHVGGSLHHPAIRQAVRDADLDVPGLPARERAERVFWWVKRHVRFREDPLEDELLIAPEALLAMPEPAGDCDDFSMLVAALLVAAGVQASFVTVAADQDDRSRFSHVYAVAWVEDGRLPLDASHGPFPGWEAEWQQPVYRRREWPVFATITPARPRRALLGTLPRRALGQTFDPFASMAAGGAGTAPPWWQQLLQAGLRTGERIAYAEFPGPAAYTQVGPYGRTEIRGGAGSAPTALGPTVLPPWLIWLGVGIAAVAVLSAVGRGRQ